VWLLDRRGGEAQQLTEVKEDLTDYRWSPDSKQMLLSLKAKEEPEAKEGAKPAPPKPIVIDRYHFKQDIQGYLSDKRDHLFLFDIATKKLTRLIGDDKTEDKYDERQAEWSPDGKWIAFVSNQEGPDPDRSNNSDVFVVEAKGGAGTNGVAGPKKLTSFTGVDGGPLASAPTRLRRSASAMTFFVFSIRRRSKNMRATGYVSISGADVTADPTLRRPSTT